MHRIPSQRKLSPAEALHPDTGDTTNNTTITTITITNRQNPAQSVTTSATTLAVGRNPRSSTLCLSHPSISGSHAVFSFVNSNWTISDAGSLNGTFLNKTRLEPHAPYRLSPDDVLHFGGDPSDFTVYFSSHSLDLASTSFPRGSLSIAKSKSFCDRLNERMIEEEATLMGGGRREDGALPFFVFFVSRRFSSLLVASSASFTKGDCVAMTRCLFFSSGDPARWMDETRPVPHTRLAHPLVYKNDALHPDAPTIRRHGGFVRVVD